MKLDEMTRQGEAETEPTLPDLRGSLLPEALEYVGEGLCSNANPGVRHGQRGSELLSDQPNTHTSATRRELHRIAQ